MADWQFRAKRVVSGVLRRLMGRKAFVRLARFLYNEARLDTPNVEIRHNGELLVQRIVVENTARDQPVSVFDVGAHVGEWTGHLLKQCEAHGLGAVRLFCFEPNSPSRATLASLRPYDGVDLRVVPVALSDAIGDAELHITKEGGGVSSLHEQVARTTDRVERVQTTTLDAFCRDAGIEAIDLVKVDVEGHEVAVLRGGTELLERQAIGVLQFEYNHRWIMSRSFLRDAFALLSPLGYRLGKVTPRGIEFYARWHPDLDTFSQGNYVACAEAWARRFPAIPWYRDSD